jgi:hypothetical protein
MNPSSYRYTPFYCEENVYHLASHAHFAEKQRQVVFISNRIKMVLFLNQRAGKEYGTVLWDYHVVLLTCDSQWLVWDLDSHLSFPVTIDEYLIGTFGYLDKHYRSRLSHFPYSIQETKVYTPLFKLIDADLYLETFASNRVHMLDKNGAYRSPPPPWPKIHPERGNNVSTFIDMNDQEYGEVVDIQEFTRRGGFSPLFEE